MLDLHTGDYGCVEEAWMIIGYKNGAPPVPDTPLNLCDDSLTMDGGQLERSAPAAELSAGLSSGAASQQPYSYGSSEAAVIGPAL